MKISYNWLQQFIDTGKTPEELSHLLTDIGLEVESLEHVQQIPGGLAGLVVGEVKSCAQHPNADRLRVTTVDVGATDLLPIVCGAPNVAEGQKVIVALEGATLYPLSGEPFTIKKSKIRGEASQGMICAEDEIGLGVSHEGIMVLPTDVAVGTAAASYFQLKDDHVFEIGLTPNRADAASHWGVARDLSALLRIPCRFPDLSKFEVNPQAEGSISVQVEDVEACPRYSALLIQGVKVAESPDWLKNQLNYIGVRPINNVVDITNYVLHGLGQPLHAFDADAIAGGAVVVRKASANEKFVTLDGVERTLDVQDLMICDAEKPMCIAGVFGGEGSGVKDATVNVFLESAYFNAVSVRKSSKRHGLKTDASFRFERGTDPEITVDALKYAAILIAEVAGGQVVSAVSDSYPNPVQPFVFDVNYSNVKRLIGTDIPNEEIRAIIQALDIDISNETETGITVTVPAYRVDVCREVDIIEEVLRIYGYNAIEIKQQLKISVTPSAKPDREVVQNQIADLLIGNGFRETLSNSLTKVDYLADETQAVRLVNPLSSDLGVMRQQILYSLLEAVAHNQKRKSADLKLFEFGKTYHLVEEVYVESQRLSLALSGKYAREHWSTSQEPSNFFHLKATVDAILRRLGVVSFQIQEADSKVFLSGLSYVSNQKVLVSFGQVQKQPLQQTDVDGVVFYADFDWDLLLRLIKKNKIVYQEVSKFPMVRRDLALLLNEDVTFEQLRAIAEKTERKLLKDVSVFDVYRGDKLPEGKKSYALSFLLQDEEKTLTDKQIDAIIKKLIYNFGKEVGAEVR